VLAATLPFSAADVCATHLKHKAGNSFSKKMAKLGSVEKIKAFLLIDRTSRPIQEIIATLNDLDLHPRDIGPQSSYKTYVSIFGTKQSILMAIQSHQVLWIGQKRLRETDPRSPLVSFRELRRRLESLDGFVEVSYTADPISVSDYITILLKEGTDASRFLEIAKEYPIRGQVLLEESK
ncbi:MAG: hypothetical protein AB1540_16490, partial [Bdellovibrionota bacterium]